MTLVDKLKHNKRKTAESAHKVFC